MNKQKISLKIDKKVLSKIQPNSGLLVSLKKTESCCSMLVESKVEIVPLESINNLENAQTVEVYREYERVVAFDVEIFDIYPKQSSFVISMTGFPSRKPKVNIPAEMVSKEVCK